MNPLLFIPSPRDIPAVKKLWHQLPYDKFIVKYKPEYEAYQEGKRYFLRHEEYSHFVVCPDDLEVTPEALETLINDIVDYPMPILSGICNLDESHPDTYNIQQNVGNFTAKKPDNTAASWITEKDLHGASGIRRMAHSGFACEFIDRILMRTIEWQDNGFFDWQMSQMCHQIDQPLMVDTRVKLYHRRTEQKPIIGNGYSFLLRYEKT